MKTTLPFWAGFFRFGWQRFDFLVYINRMMCAVRRPFFGVCLALLLAVTGQSMALVRGASAATGQMVICTGSGPQVIYVDAQGLPTSAPHPCADCVLSFFDESGGQRTVFSDVVSTAPVERRARAQLPGSDVFTGFWGRGPPWVF